LHKKRLSQTEEIDSYNDDSGHTKKKSCKWQTDGIQPSPSCKVLIETLSVNNCHGLLDLVKLVQALVTRKEELDAVQQDDISFEATLMACERMESNCALHDFHNMIWDIRLACHMNR